MIRIGSAVFVFAAGLIAAGCASKAVQQPEFAPPTEVRSDSGVLRAKVVLQPTELEFNGRKVRSYTYNGAYAAPTFRAKPGDVLELEFENRCPQPSNIHFHGLTVSPLYNGDNIFVRVDPGHTFNYKFQIPKDHTPGLYYYHAHSHGIAERQITFGFTGAVVIEGQLGVYKDLESKVTERVMVLRDIQISPFGNVPQDIVTSRTAIRTVNGLVNPILRVRPGATEYWRIANTSANVYYRLTLDDQPFWVIAEDGNATRQMTSVKEYLIGPSARVEVLVQLPAAGKYALRTQAVRTGPVGDGYPAADLVTVVCEGEPVQSVSLPITRDCCAPPVLEDLRSLPIQERRLIVFNETDNDFRVNNRIFNETRIDTRVPLGNVEEWTIRNSTDELHQFHIHQVDFQVTEINGKPVEFTGYRDNFVIPIRGEIKIIIAFTNPLIVGNFVYHCHIIEHEDGGMMATIQVYDPKNPDAIPAPADHVVAPPADARASGGPIHLTDQLGEVWRGEQADADLLLVSFGYINCKRTCPVTRQLMDRTIDELGDDGRRVLPVLVSIDPERDQPPELRAYAGGDPHRFVALTGAASEVREVAKKFGVSYSKLPPDGDGSYGLSHSTDVFLTTKDGRVLDRFDLITSPATIAERARRAILESTAAVDAEGAAATGAVVPPTSNLGGQGGAQ